MTKQKHIVIIEEDSKVSQILLEKLQSHGHIVTVLTDGDVANETVDTLAPDFIIMEIMLPGTMGDYILQHVRQCPVIARVPVTIYTNLPTLPNSISNCEESLLYKHVDKSVVSPEQFSRAIATELT